MRKNHRQPASKELSSNIGKGAAATSPKELSANPQDFHLYSVKDIQKARLAQELKDKKEFLVILDKINTQSFLQEAVELSNIKQRIKEEIRKIEVIK